ncbi:MAG: DUF1835 domain-containing protein [Gemmatimonas sp.]
MTTLHVTNGDSVGGTLLRIVPSDESVLPWRDVLHDGPVPGDVDADTLRQMRAQFLAGQDWAKYEVALADFAGRDAQLAAMRAGDHVTLWFEPDLYDQLQLLEILARFYVRTAAERPSISIVAADELLGPLSEVQLAQYIKMQRVVREADLELAAEGWEAFTSRNNRLLKTFAQTESALFEADSYQSDNSVVLPHVHPALRRLVQEYPSEQNGLSRTEQQIVNALLKGAKTVGATYVEAHAPNEDIVWLGDTSYVWYVERLMTGPVPLIEFVSPTTDNATRAIDASGTSNSADVEFWKRQVRLTGAGRAVAEGMANAVLLNGIDRWIGGVHLQQDATVGAPN